MSRVLLVLLYVLISLAGQAVRADLLVIFSESAPKDLFAISNTGECELRDLELEIDLAPSTGRLIFDTTATGAGEEVFQPFEVTAGRIELISSAAVKDGDSSLSLGIQSLAPGQTVSFTIDVDDRLTASELGRTRIANSEISGALVKARWPEQQSVTGVFGRDSRASVTVPDCP